MLSGDDPAALGTAPVQGRLIQWLEGGGSVVGVGGRGSFQVLDPLFEHLGARGMNLGEALEPGTLAALVAMAGAFVGGGEVALLARAMGIQE